MLLAGDIGGTKTNLAVYTVETGLAAPLAEATFPSKRYASLTEVVAEFRRHTGLPFQQAVFGVAGPVVNGRAEVTNLPWVLDEETLVEELETPVVKLLNDLEAIANAVPILEAQDVHTLHPGRAQMRAPLAVVAPGTGLGEAFLLWDGHTYRAHPSEGGHASFAPVGEEQVDLLRHLLQRHHHVSYERVCSGGLGIPNLYRFFKETGRHPEPDWLAEELAEAADPTPIIVQTALKRGEDAPICRAVVDMFLDILAGEAGNMVLKVMATGGVYLGGGLPPRLLEAFDADRFLAVFSGKGRFADLLRNVPVHVILNQKAALLGAARYGLEILSTER